MEKEGLEFDASKFNDPQPENVTSLGAPVSARRTKEVRFFFLRIAGVC